MNHRLLQILVLAALTFVPDNVFGAAERKPNFLFIYTDDQRYDALGVVQREQGEKGRYPWFKTPNIDRIAAEGARFRNAFVTLPLCAPSRAVFLTGQYNHLNGVANNRTPFPEDSVTHATLLKTAGYKTAYIGKWHMGGQKGKRPSFDYSASFIGQGHYFDCPFEINGQSTPTKGWVDDVSTQYAIDFMRENKDKPFSIVLGFKSTHGPTSPPERAKDRFPNVKARPVPNLTVPAIYGSGQVGRGQVGSDGLVQMNINYFRCLSATDDNVGQLLAALDELKLGEDTVVIYSSDNGYYQGEHGLGDKRSGYEESIRIPLVVRYPRAVAKGKVVDQMALNLDLAPTLVDFAGVTIPKQMQGRSWRPLLTDKPVKWRDSIMFQYFFETQFPNTPTLYGIRTETAKLIKYPGHEEWTELFDLANDPYETKNLAKDPSSGALLNDLQARLNKKSTAFRYTIPEYADKQPAPGSAPEPQNSKKKKKRAKNAES
jgi:arylsulfatase A-like enzyme